MNIDRRDFLKHFTATLVGIAGFKGLWTLAGDKNSLSSMAAQALYTCREYSGSNFVGWKVVVGDAIYACEGEPPVTLEDIKSVHENGYSELQANILRRCIMAHNITFKRIITDRAFDYIHCARYQFRLPFLPSPDINDEENAQTLEGGLFVWDGKGTRFDYGMGFQIVLNPWINESELSVWELKTWKTDESGNGHWITVGHLEPDTEWHSVDMTVDFQEKIASLTIDGTDYPAEYTKTKKPTEWAKETAARFQAEIVSVWPEPAGIRALHRTQFRDWSWVWKKNELCDTYLPVAIKQPMPTNCADAWIVSPRQINGMPITSPVTVKWVPDSCLMVLQYYQDGHLKGEYKNVSSGTSIQIATPGRTEIKIWKPGSSLPADSVWVDVE